MDVGFLYLYQSREMRWKMTVVVVDDDNLVCVSLKTIIETNFEIHVVGIGHNGLDAIKLYKEFVPNIMLMDIRMDKMTGLEAAEQIIASNQNAKVLFLTTFEDNEYIIKALKLGAKGYILKQNFETIIPSLQAVYSGQSVFGGDIVSKIPTMIDEEKNIDLSRYGLYDKEIEIISLVAEGLNNKEIAAKLFLSEGTVRNYLSTILNKLNLRDRTQLAIFYFKHGS